VAEATGASTNLILHTLAIAHEIGLAPDEVLPLFNQYKDATPLVAHVNPNADYDMEDFYKAGGIPRVMQRIAPVLNLDALTVTGKVMGENLANYRFKYPENPDVIRTMEDPFEPTGGLVILRGNLAPDSAVAKPSGIEQENRVFTGPAIVFNSEAECMKGIAADKVKPGNVIVIRYEGPKGGPGAREMGFALKMLRGKGLLSDISVITDGRYSGTNNGCFVGHISPEAAQGGPLAIVRDGDLITVDVVDKREVHLHLSDEEIAARLAEWKYEPKPLTGQLARYAALVQSCNTGAVLEVK
jgi:dihydroxy-acid dehydratase